MINMIINYKFTAMSLFIQLILVETSSKNPEEMTNALSGHTRNENESMPIELRGFLKSDILNTEVGRFCLISCKEVTSTFGFKRDYIMCQVFSSKNSGQYCTEFGDVTWAKDEKGEVYGSGTECDSPVSTATNRCQTCLCIRKYKKVKSGEPVRSFSLRPQISDVRNNMVVTGLMFKLENTMIHLKIRESKLMPDGSLKHESSWKELGDIVEKSATDDPPSWVDLKPDEDYFSLTYEQRTLFLDDILVPQGYVVTGVKFALVNALTGHRELKMQVKGSKVQYPSYKLIDDSDEWFDDGKNFVNDTSYNRSRKEINLLNLDRPRPATEGNEILDTNRFLVFTFTDLKKDLGNHVIPYLIEKPVKSEVPLQGIGLSYRHVEGSGGYVTLKIFLAHLRKFSVPNETPETSTDDSIAVSITVPTQVHPGVSTGIDRTTVETGVGATTKKIEVDVITVTPKIDKTTLKTEVEATTEETEVDVITATPKIDKTTLKTEVEATTEETEVDVITATPEVDKTTLETEVGADTEETEVDVRTVTPQVDETTVDTRVEATTKETEVDVVTVTPKVDKTTVDTKVEATTKKTGVDVITVTPEVHKTTLETEVGADTEQTKVDVRTVTPQVDKTTVNTEVEATTKETGVDVVTETPKVDQTTVEIEVEVTTKKAEVDVITVKIEIDRSDISSEADLASVVTKVSATDPNDEGPITYLDKTGFTIDSDEVIISHLDGDSIAKNKPSRLNKLRKRLHYYDRNRRPVARLQNSSPSKHHTQVIAVLIVPLWISLQ